MDGSRFDRLTRALFAGGSDRRRILGAFAAVLGGFLGSRAHLTTAQTDCGLVGADCTVNEDCCPGARCNSNNKCVCRTKAGFSPCPVSGGQRCFKLATDEQHCGDCDTQCGSDKTCCGGKCVTCPEGGSCAPNNEQACVCPTGQKDCGGVCTDVQNDFFNCGDCNKKCRFVGIPPKPEICCKGQCRKPCGAGQTFEKTNCRCICDATGKPACGGVCCAADDGCVSNRCCRLKYTSCDPDGEKCCDQTSTNPCSGSLDGQRVCCGSVGALCPSSCEPNSKCTACCGQLCDGDKKCSCTPPHQPCPSGCRPGQSCRGCCAGTCRLNGTCGCLPVGAACRTAAGVTGKACCTGGCADGKCCVGIGGTCSKDDDCCQNDCNSVTKKCQ